MAIAGAAVVVMADLPGERKPRPYRCSRRVQETSSFSARRGV